VIHTRSTISTQDIELSVAQRVGSHLRVAIIASAADLGSVTALWRQPQSYARLVGPECLRINWPLL
jgi:hypothetical protein